MSKKMYIEPSTEIIRLEGDYPITLASSKMSDPGKMPKHVAPI